MATNKVLNTKSDAELLSYAINSNPILSAELDLPVQGESIAPYGKIIMSNQRYKNAFLNVCNLIGLTIIKRNAWADPWDFTERGTIRFGQSVRELIADLVEAHDYNAMAKTPEKVLDNYIPNVYEYIHEVNFQKFYATTVSDSQMAMAFTEEGALYDFIEELVRMNYESYVYDRYQLNKYMLAKRIIDGTVTPSYISDYASLNEREKVAKMKSVSNKMSFRSPNYNPAGIRKATSFDNQILIMSTDFEADFSTSVMATSFFRDEADFRARLRLCDGFGNIDEARLREVLGSDYEEFGEGELTALNSIPAVLISNEWFMDYVYSFDTESGIKETDFYNPMILRNTSFLHAWLVFSTSPFENATVFTATAPNVTALAVSPASATVIEGQTVKLSAVATTTGYANPSVTWSVADEDADYIEVKADGTVIAKEAKVVGASKSTKADPDPEPTYTAFTVTATSVFKSTVTDTASITIIPKA